MITKIKTFKHNLWTNEFTRYLYEGKYSPMLEKYVEEFVPSIALDGTNIKKLPLFKIRVRSMEFVGYDPKSTYLSVDGFSPLIISLMKSWKIARVEGNTKIAKDIAEIIVPLARREFVSVISIKRPQAKTLIDMQHKNLSKKQVVQMHKSLGFHKK